MEKKFKRQLLRFASPRQQFLILLPTLAMLGFGVIISFTFMGHLRDGAVELMMEGGVPDADIELFLQSSRSLWGVFWAGVLLLLATGFYWGWLVSHRVFGSFTRLARDLEEIRRGAKDPSELYVREDDYIHDLIISIRDAMVSLKKGGKKV
jgi:hypothetical protein